MTDYRNDIGWHAGVRQMRPSDLDRAALRRGRRGRGLLYTSSSVMVVAAQDLATQPPAAASGVVVGLTTGVAGALHVALGRLQEIIGLTQGMTVGLAMVIPAAAIALAVLLRHPGAAGRPPTAARPTGAACANRSVPVGTTERRYVRLRGRR